MIGEVNAWTSNLMNLLWLIGTFTFATVIGIITEDVTQTIMARPQQSFSSLPLKPQSWTHAARTGLSAHMGPCPPSLPQPLISLQALLSARACAPSLPCSRHA